MKNIKIYNYNKSYDKNLIKTIINKLNNRGLYYISRSWENGPHLVITLENEDSSYIDDVVNKLEEQLLKIPTNEVQIEIIKKQYINNHHRISRLENKACDETLLKEHGAVEVIDNKLVYLNEGITRIIHNCRFILQPILNELYFKLENELIDMAAIMPILFYEVSECYRENNKNKGFFSYISHVQGFFELSRKQKIPYSEEIFENEYSNIIEKINLYWTFEEEFIGKWRVTWNDIMSKLKEEVPGYIDESYKNILYETFEALEKDYSNDFHKKFVEFAKKTNFIDNVDATAYRFLVNILYLSLPFLRISALKKQKYCYMAYRQTEQIYKLDWREVVSGEI